VRRAQFAMSAQGADDSALNALLQDALDDFDDLDGPPAEPAAAAPAAAPATAATPAAAPAATPAAAAPAAPSSDASPAQLMLEKEADDLAKQLMAGLDLGGGGGGGGGADADVERTLQELARSAEALSAEGGGAGGGDDAAACMELLQKLATEASGGGAPSDVMGALGSALGGGGGAPSSGGGGGGASGGGGADDPALDGLLDNLVGQLLSKDVMLEPMQHLHAEFPRYLAAHAEKLRPDDLARYRKQQEAVAAILRAYETEPDNADRIAELMQQMQAYGAPPPEIAGPVADGACTVS